MPSHANLRALVRQLRAAPIKRRPKWLPPRAPDLIATRYYRAIRPLVDAAAQLFEREGMPRVMRLLEDLRHRQGKQDAARLDVLPIIVGAIEIVAEVLGEEFAAVAVEEAAAALGEAIESLTANGLAQEIIAAAADLGATYATEKGAAALHESIAAAWRDLHHDASTRTTAKRAGQAAAQKILASRLAIDPQSPEMDAALVEVRRIAELFAGRIRPDQIYDVVQGFGKDLDYHARLELDKQLRAAINVPLSAMPHATWKQIEPWTKENVDLIVTLPPRFFADIEKDVIEAFASGEHPDTFKEKISGDYGAHASGDFNAERIARDQMGRLGAQINQAQLKGLGVEWATWKTTRSNRVCNICFPREGLRFRLGEGIDGQLPGFCHPQCSCWCAPDLDALING